MIHVLLDMDAFARRELHLRPGGHCVGPAVAVDGHIGFLVNGLVGQTVVDADQNIAAAAIDNVLGLVPMEMIWGILSLFHIEQLFGVDLRILVLHRTIAVADRDERHADLVKVAETVVRNVPTKHTVADFVVFMPLVTLFLPLLRGKIAERRQVAMLACAHGFQLF